MTSIAKLQADYEKALAHAQDIMAQKDKAIQAARDKYAAKLQDANDKAAQAQRELNQAEAAHALADREDGPAVALALIEQGGLTREAVEAAGITLP